MEGCGAGKAATAAERHNDLRAQIKSAEKRMEEIGTLRTHIIQYETRDTYKTMSCPKIAKLCTIKEETVEKLSGAKRSLWIPPSRSQKRWDR